MIQQVRMRSIFIAENFTPVDDVYRKQVDFDGTPTVLEILDTAGREKYSGILL